MQDDPSPLDGCSDGNCKVAGKATGQHTNGGCRCLRYPEDRERFQKALADLKAKLAEAEKRATEAEAEMHACRPKADCYDRVCEALGIGRDILGYVDGIKKRGADAEERAEKAEFQHKLDHSLADQWKAKVEAWETWWARSWDCSATPGHPGTPESQ